MSDAPDELDVQEAAVRAALKRRMAEIQTTAARLADPTAWIQARPWTSCASAASLGLALGWVLGGRPQKQPDGSAVGRDHGGRSLASLVTSHLLPAAQPMLKELLDILVGSGAPQTSPGRESEAADVPEPETLSSGMSGGNRAL